MNKQSLIRTTNKIGLILKKNSPKILMGVGIAGSVVSTVLACKATLKVKDILDEKNETVEQIHNCVEDETLDYNEEDKKKDLTILYAQTGVKLAKLYLPSIALGALSIASIISGYKILNKRNVALAAAYTVVDKGFKNYRKNVVERFGEEVDRELRHNIKAKQIEEKYIDKDGNEKTRKKKVYEIAEDKKPGEGISEYAKFFDEWNTDEHSKDPEYNLMFLRKQQDYANEVLKHQGYLFLNEVYDMLGIPRTQAGQVVGWIYDENNPTGDNYVDFGIYDLHDQQKRDFVNGLERNILLDFNVDGVIYDKI